VGTYLALATLNRVVAPRSKLAFAAWWQATAGDRLVKLPAAALDHRRFWDAMDQVTVADLRAIERAVAARMVERFDLDLVGLVLDMTNFATFVDSANARNTIAARGHAKQKRFDLRLVGVGLVVTSDGGVPILSHAYQGNRPDVTQFTQVIDELVARFGALARATDALTVVYDAGCDSADGQADVEASPLHFVGSLRPSDIIPTCWPSPPAASGWWTPSASRAYRRWRPARWRWAPSGGSSSPTRTASTPPRHAALSRPWPPHAAALASCRPAWRAAGLAGHASRSRPRSARSCRPTGWTA
jgi:hypothetical protein